jgi:serine/threonine-protein kinase
VNRDRWERIQALFHGTADLPRSEQRAYLAERCGDDPTLVDEVMAMLAEDRRGDSPLHRDLAELAERVLGAPRDGGAPQEIGRYRLLQPLGEGGMGVVWLAERVDLENRVAIKILRDAWLSPARRARFAAEQRMLAQLEHPGIARLYDADTLPDGTPWFAMEYVAGKPITVHCAEHHASVAARLGLFRLACEAVLHAHQHAFIHRDLKPSNILVTSDWRVKLLDFGIASPIDRLDAPLDRTRTELRLMTPAYAAPEQIQGRNLGVHTDVYALGVLLYELVTGRLPHDVAGRSPAEAERLLTETTPERPSVVVRRSGSGPDGALRRERGIAWDDLDALCLTAMQADPARRYRTVDSLIRDVDHLLQGEPLDARPDGAGYRLRKFARRHWRPLAAAAAAVVTVVTLVSFYTVRLTEARNAALAEAERTQRIQAFMGRLFEGGDEAVGPADTLRVRTMLSRGVHEVRALDGSPLIQAELFQTLGGTFQVLGDLDQADSLLQAALDLRRRHLKPDDPDVAKSLVALGLLRAEQSEFDEAERLVREAVVIGRRHRVRHPAGEARAVAALGNVLTNRGSYDAAIEVLTEAVRLDSLAAVPMNELSSTLTDLANSHFYAGHYATSDSLNQRILELDRRLYGEHHPNVAADLINLGAIQAEWGHPAEAEERYRRALAIYRNWYGAGHFEVAATMTMVARVLIPQGRTQEAGELLREALAIRERVYGPSDPKVASTLNELGRIAQAEGRLDAAEAAYRRMREIYTAAYDDRHYLIGTAVSNLGTVELARGRHAGAERLFHEALRRYGETLPDDHLYVGMTRMRLGRALLRQGRMGEAERESRGGYEIAIRKSQKGGDWLVEVRRDLAEEYERLGRPEEAARFRAELGSDAATAGSR